MPNTLQEAADRVTEAILSYPKLPEVLDYRYISFSKTEMSNVVKYHLYKEHTQEKLPENMYTDREIENAKFFIIDGLRAVYDKSNTDFDSGKVDYVALNIIMYGIFHRKTAATIINALMNRNDLDYKIFSPRAICDLQANTIADLLYSTAMKA